MECAHDDLSNRTAKLLSRAVRESGKSLAEIARLSRLKRDTLRRIIGGSRAATIVDAISVLEAAGLAGQQSLILMLLADEDFALARSGTGAAKFLCELMRHLPQEIVEQLGENVEDLRPRWANGTAKMFARILGQHIADLNRRGDSIGRNFTLPGPID